MEAGDPLSELPSELLGNGRFQKKSGNNQIKSNARVFTCILYFYFLI